MAYTNIDDPSAHFYSYAFSKSSGTGSATFDGNSDLQPDFLWVKSRTNADGHEVWDSTRGVNSSLFTHATEAEDTAANRIVSFDTDGFTWGNAGNLNAAGDFVSWAWKANGGTTSSLSNTGPDSVVQVNSDAKFVIGTYTGNGSNSNVKHGLGETPDMLIVKRRTGGTGSWAVWHKDLTSAYWLRLDTDVAQASGVWDGLDPNSEKFFITGGSSNVNISGSNYVFYAWKSVQGYSKFGKFVGNGNHDGTFVYTGFKPAFVLMKIFTTAGYYWRLLDNARSTSNESGFFLMPDRTDAEFNGIIHGSNIGVDFLSNGFKLRSDHPIINLNGSTSIYMTFAENPFTTSTGVPTTAR